MSKHAGPRHAAQHKRPQQVRIIGGQWKRTPLPVPDAEGLRPTPDRVRETVFNWISHLFDGAWESVACLDLFAGTGVLGFEAASRGAQHVLMVESHMPAVRQLQLTCDKLRATQVEIVRGDAFAVAQGLQRRFQLIFLDPPYQHGWLEKMLPCCKKLLAEGGLVYAESEVSLLSDPAPEWLADWEIVRADSAGMVHYHLLREKLPAVQA
jgi:16S rRNA (guanine(966)-N(2))-methyltransferase RsmD